MPKDKISFTELISQYKSILLDFVLVKLFFIPIWLVHLSMSCMIKYYIVNYNHTILLEEIHCYFELIGFILILVSEFVEFAIVFFKRFKLYR